MPIENEMFPCMQKNVRCAPHICSTYKWEKHGEKKNSLPGWVVRTCRILLTPAFLSSWARRYLIMQNISQWIHFHGFLQTHSRVYICHQVGTRLVLILRKKYHLHFTTRLFALSRHIQMNIRTAMHWYVCSFYTTASSYAYIPMNAYIYRWLLVNVPSYYINICI